MTTLELGRAGEDLAAARERAYEAVGLISWDGEQHRTDIARAAAAGEVAVPAGSSAPGGDSDPT